MLSKAFLLATVLATGFGTLNDDDWPPMRFQKIGTAQVIFAEQSGIDAACGKAPDGFVTEGCSNDARIVLRDPCTFSRGDEFARVACHELAHHFGHWPADHPL